MLKTVLSSTNMLSTEAISHTISKWFNWEQKNHDASWLVAVITSHCQTACINAERSSKNSTQLNIIFNLLIRREWDMLDMDTLAALLLTDISWFLVPERKSIVLPIELRFTTLKLMSGWSSPKLMRDVIIIQQLTSTINLSIFLEEFKIRTRNILLPLRGCNFPCRISTSPGKSWIYQAWRQLSQLDKEQECAKLHQTKSWLSEDSTENSWATTTSSDATKTLANQRDWRNSKTTRCKTIKLCSHSRCQPSVTP